MKYLPYQFSEESKGLNKWLKRFQDADVLWLVLMLEIIIKKIFLHRHKDKVFPKVPSPSLLFDDMYDSKKGMMKVIYKLPFITSV